MTCTTAELTLLRGRQSLRRIQLLARGITLFYLLGQANFVVLGKQRILPDVGEIEPNQILFVPLNSLLRHRSILRSDSRHQKFFVPTTCSPPAGVPLTRALYDNHPVKRRMKGRNEANRARSH